MTIKINADTSSGLELESDTSGIIDIQSGGTTKMTVGTTIDIQGNELVLDADADTSIHADTDDQIDFKVGGSDVAKIDSNGNFSHNGIEVDMWRMSSDLTTNNGVVGVDSTIERVDDATFAKIGTGMSVSSGKWTFPRTGLYEIKVQAFWVCTAGDTAIVQTRGTSDDGSNYDVLAWASGGDLDNAKGSFYSQCFFNCTNTSTHKVQFNIISLLSGSSLQSSSDFNVTSFSFIRLGDSQ